MQRRILDPPLCWRESCSHQKTGALSVDSNGFHRQHASFIFYLFLSRMRTHCPHVSAPCHSPAHHPRTQSTAYPEHRAPAGAGAGTILPSYPMKSHSQPIRYSAGRYIPSVHRLSHGPVRVLPEPYPAVRLPDRSCLHSMQSPGT